MGASNAAGTTWANYQSGTTAATLTPPAAPSFTATPVSSSQINLAWTGVAGATGYLVDEWINGVWTKIGSAGQRQRQLRGHRLERQYHLLLRGGRFQRGRHDLGELPEHNHIPKLRGGGPPRGGHRL